MFVIYHKGGYFKPFWMPGCWARPVFLRLPVCLWRRGKPINSKEQFLPSQDALTQPCEGPLSDERIACASGSNMSRMVFLLGPCSPCLQMPNVIIFYRLKLKPGAQRKPRGSWNKPGCTPRKASNSGLRAKWCHYHLAEQRKAGKKALQMEK